MINSRSIRNEIVETGVKMNKAIHVPKGSEGMN